MYRIGQKINIGIYGGFRHHKIKKREAEVTVVDKPTGLIHIKVFSPDGGCRKMFGYENDLIEMENNFYV
jgi:hypothetical protein